MIRRRMGFCQTVSAVSGVLASEGEGARRARGGGAVFADPSRVPARAVELDQADRKIARKVAMNFSVGA